MDLGEIIVGLPIIKWILGDKEEITPSNPSANDLFDKMWEAADNNCGEGEEGKPLEITIKHKGLDVSKIKEYIPDKEAKKFIYRPDTLEAYIGQKSAKAQLKSLIKITKTLRPIHLIVSGWAGCGKSTIVFLLQKLLDAELIYRIPEQLNEPEEIVKILNQINSNKKLTILFLDEIHQLKQKTGELFYPILEDFIISEKNIKPFIFAGATTNLDIIQTKLSPLYDRIHFKIHLTKYDEQELTTIISNYKKQLYPDIKIKKEDLKIIAKNAKQTPRIAIALLLKLLVEKDIQTVLEQEDIIYEGLNKTDVKIMGTLNEFNKPIGSKALSQVVGITEKDYLVIYENYLCEKKFIIRTSRGRILTEKGKKILKEL